MKKGFVFMFLAIIIVFACAFKLGEVKPTLTKKYSNEEVDRMLTSHHLTHSRDVIPEKILQDKFTSDFPNAYDIDWEASENLYEVECEIERTDYKAFYTKEGELIMYEIDIRKHELPAIVKNVVLQKYPSHKIDDVDKIIKGDGVTYKVELDAKRNDLKVFVKEDGTFVKEIPD